MGKAIVQSPIAIGAAFALAFCWAMQSAHNATFGPFLEWLANLGISKDVSFVHIHIHPFRFAHRVDHALKAFWSWGIQHSEKAFVRALNAVVEPFLLLVGVTVALGLTGYEGLQALWGHIAHSLPRVIERTVVKPVTNKITKTVTNTASHVTHVTKVVKATQAQVRHAVNVAVHSIATTMPRLGHLERAKVDYDKLHKWLKRGLLGALGATITLTALKRIGLGWTRCTNVSKLGKRVCGVHPQWLGDFLAGMTVIVGATSFVEFVEEAQKGEELALSLLSRFVRELDGLELDRATAAAQGFATIIDGQ